MSAVLETSGKVQKNASKKVNANQTSPKRPTGKTSPTAPGPKGKKGATKPQAALTVPVSSVVAQETVVPTRPLSGEALSE